MTGGGPHDGTAPPSDGKEGGLSAMHCGAEWTNGAGAVVAWGAWARPPTQSAPTNFNWCVAVAVVAV